MSLKFSKNIEYNIEHMRTSMNNSSDFLSRDAVIENNKIVLIAIEGMVNLQTFAELIARPISESKKRAFKNPEDIYSYFVNESLVGLDTAEIYDFDKAFRFIMSGFALLLINGVDKGVVIGAQGFPVRSISEPSGEVNLKGSKEGFTEPIRLNLTMIRRRIKSPSLTFEMQQTGTKSKTDLCIVYLADKVSPELIDSVKNKLSKVEIDVVLESGYLLPFLQGKESSLFTDVGSTERPDTLCAKINEGRVAVLVDGTPFALIIPYLFSENFQSLDDYAHRPYYASFIRILKFVSFLMTILLPGFYVAAATFHPELFPSELLYNISSAQQSTPFPLVLEALIIHVIFEIMREAGLRLPRQIGHAVSIVGALVIGTAAVTAGLIGAPMLMIIAVTAISSFVVPSLYEAVAVLRFVFIILGGMFGLFGIAIGVCCALINMSKLSNFGVPYLAPISPLSAKSLRDVFVRASWKKLQKGNTNIKNMNGVNNPGERE